MAIRFRSRGFTSDTLLILVMVCNPSFEKITGLRYDPTRDQNLLDALKDPELARNIMHGLGQAAQGKAAEENIYIGKDKYALHVESAKNTDDRIHYYIVNLRQVD